MSKPRNDMSFHKLIERTMRKIKELPQSYFDEQRENRRIELKQEREKDKLRDIRRSSMNYEKLLSDGGLSPFQVQRYTQLLKEQKERQKP